MEEIEAFKRRIRGKIEVVAQEAKKNHMMVGQHGFIVPNYCFYKPHNYRLYFDFKKTNFHPEKPWSEPWFKLRRINSTEWQAKTDEFNIRVKKTQVEIINKRNEWFRVAITEDSEKEIQKVVEKKDQECIDALKAFIKLYGGSSTFTITNRHCEDKVKSEESIDLIPIKQKFHNKMVKKVYNEGNVEFSSPAFTANYLTTRAIENIAPKIADSLRYANPLRVLKSCKSISEVHENSDLILMLYENEKEELLAWSFKNFSV